MGLNAFLVFGGALMAAIYQVKLFSDSLHVLRLRSL